MINMQIFSVRDSKAELFIQPFCSPTIATACRDFETACNDESSQFNKHSGDYTLFHVATFDQDSGIVTPCETAVNLGLASTFIRENN